MVKQLDWFEDQLVNAGSDEKFLIMQHIYETAAWWSSGAFKEWKEDDYQARFFQLMEDYRDKILLEVTGHDHLTDIRAHSLPDNENEYYLNKVLFPGITASSLTNPGYGTFVYDTET